jgi:hypothetical protein
MHDGMIRDKQYGIENNGLVIFRNLGFSFLRTERDFVAVPQARKKLLIRGRSLGCPGGIRGIYCRATLRRGRGRGPGHGPSLKTIYFCRKAAK